MSMMADQDAGITCRCRLLSGAASTHSLLSSSSSGQRLIVGAFLEHKKLLDARRRRFQRLTNAIHVLVVAGDHAQVLFLSALTNRLSNFFPGCSCIQEPSFANFLWHDELNSCSSTSSHSFKRINVENELCRRVMCPVDRNGRTFHNAWVIPEYHGIFPYFQACEAYIGLPTFTSEASLLKGLCLRFNSKARPRSRSRWGTMTPSSSAIFLSGLSTASSSSPSIFTTFTGATTASRFF
mmetsp:Transcript_53325/g.79655  ORF Transcript_53325/g.79655 Transcript_53325/m.79655 type:complete len:238 (-) Transcript_53325:148-861(-)